MKRLPDDPRFKHVDLHHTNLRVTFARVRREMAEAEERRKATVTPIKRKAK
jgi:hypothetical protein